MDNVYFMDHPLIQHKISKLREAGTGTNEFRKLVEEITVLMGYEALRDLPMEEVEVKTPLETCRTPFIAGKKLAVVPILRAGLGMPEKLTACGVEGQTLLADLDSIAETALADVCAPGNPRPAAREDLKDILKELM